MNKKGGLFVIFMLILISFSIYGNAIQPIQPIQDVEGLIRDEGQATRTFCQEQWNEKEISFKAEFENTANELEKSYKSILWLDRVLTLILIIFGVFLSSRISRFLDKQADKRAKLIDKLELGEAPKPKGVENETDTEKTRN